MDEKQWIRDALDSDPAKNRAGLAKALGRAPSMVTSLLDGPRELKVSEIAAISDYLQVDPPPFHRSRFVPLLGKVAGGHSAAVLFGDNGGPIDWIAVPFRALDARAALEVEGDSMRGLAGNGYMVFIGEKHEPPTADQLDQLCVCGLPDGQRVVKFLHASRYPAKFDLHSSNGEPLLAQNVVWAAVVTAIIPGAQAGQLARRSEGDEDGEFLNFEKLA